MKMKAKIITSNWIFAALVAILVLCRPLPVFAVSTVTISPATDGVFSILGTGIEGASAIELAVSYDTTTLANPRVVEGPLIAGAMTATNSAVPGTVRLVIIRISPISGSGVIATLTFDRTGPSPGRISALTARLANANGAPLLAQVLITNPPNAVADASAASQTQNAPAGSEVLQTNAGSLGTPAPLLRTAIAAAQPAAPEELNGTLDALHPGERDAQPAAKDTAPASGIDQVAKARTAESPTTKDDNPAPEKTQTKNIFTQKSVLERFREYQGERTADTFVSLFDQENLIGCRQDPPVAISDGKTVVKVTFISPPGNITSSDVAVRGAKLLSLRRDPDNSNTWIVKLVPEKDGYQASIAVLQGALKMVYPLTIAPMVNVDFSQSGKVTKADFNRYLTKYKTAKPFSPDFTGDGKWDYRDDYILTANYLFAVKNAQQKSKAPVSQARLM
jgi:hypothetical protein